MNKKPDFEADQIKRDEDTFKSIQSANEMADRIRNDPAERERVLNAINREK